jgi:2-amino-4-hydroxy-6-hydroxymethyldihydropteridine diphosphokinase/dihydropteroate synthase
VRNTREVRTLEERIWGTAATVTASILGGAHIIRAHDVCEMVQVARVARCLLALQ